MTEHQIQDQIRDALQYMPEIFITRTNVGSGWVGKYNKNYNGTVTIYNPRWFSTGLPKGFPDLCGYKSITIPQEMVGKKIAQFAFIEVKKDGGRVRPEQLDFQRKFLADGAVGGIAHSVEEAIIILRGGFLHDRYFFC